jgi:general secretion pathway protein I
VRIWRSRRLRRECRAARGFTLIEVLVAFAILAVSLVVLMRAFSAGLDSIERSERHATATLLARSTLEQVGITIPLVPSELSREAGDEFVVRLRIAPSATALPVPMADGLVVPYEATARVEWPGGAVTLTTMRLAQERATETQPARPAGGVDNQRNPQ